MLTEMNRQITLAEEDHTHLINHINKNRNHLITTPGMAELIRQIENAWIIPDSDFPWNTIRLNSKAIIRDKIARINYTYVLVLPEYSDHRKCRVSVFSTIGKSLLGRKRGEDIQWESPIKKRFLTIMAISQEQSKQSLFR